MGIQEELENAKKMILDDSLNPDQKNKFATMIHLNKELEDMRKTNYANCEYSEQDDIRFNEIRQEFKELGLPFLYDEDYYIYTDEDESSYEEEESSYDDDEY